MYVKVYKKECSEYNLIRSGLLNELGATSLSFNGITDVVKFEVDRDRLGDLLNFLNSLWENGHIILRVRISQIGCPDLEIRSVYP